MNITSDFLAPKYTGSDADVHRGPIHSGPLTEVFKLSRAPEGSRAQKRLEMGKDNELLRQIHSFLALPVSFEQRREKVRKTVSTHRIEAHETEYVEDDYEPDEFFWTNRGHDMVRFLRRDPNVSYPLTTVVKHAPRSHASEETENIYQSTGHVEPGQGEYIRTTADRSVKNHTWRKLWRT